MYYLIMKADTMSSMEPWEIYADFFNKMSKSSMTIIRGNEESYFVMARIFEGELSTSVMHVLSF